MSIENILSQMQELTKQLGIEIKGPISTQQDELVIGCSNIEFLTSAVINLTEAVISFVNSLILQEESRVSPNLSYLAQLERLRCILELLLSRLESLPCNERCPELLEELYCILVKLYSVIDSIFLLLIVSVEFRDASVFFECYLCDLIGKITDLENLVKELVCIIIALISCETDTCTPCYVATNFAKRPRPSINISLNQKKSNCNCKK